MRLKTPRIVQKLRHLNKGRGRKIVFIEVMNGNLEVNKCLRQLGLSLKIDTFNKILRRKHFFEDVRASGEHVSVDRNLLSIANEDPIGKGRIVVPDGNFPLWTEISSTESRKNVTLRSWYLDPYRF